MVLLTNDRANKDKALADGIETLTLKEYITSLNGCDALIDKLAKCEEDYETGGDVVHDATENRPGRRRFQEYRPHLPMAEIQEGVKSGRFLQGTFFVSAYNCREGNVLTQMDNVDTKPGFEKGKV